MAYAACWLVFAGLILALVCYYLPWYTHSTAGFTMNALRSGRVVQRAPGRAQQSRAC